MRKFILLVLTIIKINIDTFAVNCIATSGNWNDITTWSCGTVPTGGDVVLIPSGVTVSNVPSNYNTDNTIVMNVYGTINMGNSGKMRLSSLSRINLYGGTITTGTNNNGNNNYISIGTTTVWSGSDGVLTGNYILSSSCRGVDRCSSVALPITDIFFDLKNKNGHIEISVDNKNKHDYILQKSYDYTMWEDIHVYNDIRTVYTDYITKNGVIYYRIKTESDVSDVKSIIADNFYIYPNPSKDVVNILTSSDDYIVKIYSMDNILLNSIDKIDKIVLDKGIYILSIITENYIYIEKVVIY